MDPAAWQGRRVLVTGHSGFKGGWLALWLQELGARVTGYSGPPPSRPSLFELARVADGLEASIEGDVRDASHLSEVIRDARPELVVHMAAQPIVRRSLVEPAETWAVNVMGTVSVLEAVRGAAGTVRGVLVVTSDKCYRDVETGRPQREDDPLGGKDPYSASKAAQEIVTHAHRATLLAEAGVAVATARAGNVIGGGDWGADRLVPDLFRSAMAGEPLVVRNPEAVRPWQHVLNPLSGYLALGQALLERGPRSGIDAAWNFGPGPGDEQPVSVVVEKLRRLWGEDLEVRIEPDPQGAKESAVLRLDSARAREQLGWSPRWDLDSGLAATVDWFGSFSRGEDVRSKSLQQIADFSAG